MDLLGDIKRAAVISEFTRIFKSCIMRYGAKYQVDNTGIGMMIGLNENAAVYYRILVKNSSDNFEKKEDITILEVLNVRITDVKHGYDHILPPELQAILIKLAEENKIPPSETAVMLLTNTRDIYLYLYQWWEEKNQGAYLKQLDIEELF